MNNFDKIWYVKKNILIVIEGWDFIEYGQVNSKCFPRSMHFACLHSNNGKNAGYWVGCFTQWTNIKELNQATLQPFGKGREVKRISQYREKKKKSIRLQSEEELGK